MLTTMSSELQKDLENMEAYDMIFNLKEMFQQQARQERNETTKALHSCKMAEGTSANAHVRKMKGYIEHLDRLGFPLMMRIKAQSIRDAGASRRFIRNSILIIENSDSGGCETLETPNIFLFPSVLSFITILIWSCFILERFILQVKVEFALFNLESVFC